ncbi:hypothetical protein IWW38_002560, partial [Coemansia aciculifera]
MLHVPYLTSCNHCRDKKRKCDGARPTCSLCRTHGVECEYRRSRRFRKHAADGDNNNSVAAIQPIQPTLSMTSGHLQSSGLPVIVPPPQHLGNFQGGAATTTMPIGNAALSFVPTSAADHRQFPTTAATAVPQPPPPQLPSEIDALTRLLAGDMYPQTQQLPQPILQGVNTFMSPFSSAREQPAMLPEWISQYKPEAAIISNLENIASAFQTTSPLLPLPNAVSTDSFLFGNLSDQSSGCLHQQQPALYSVAGSLSMPGLLAPIDTSLPTTATANMGVAPMRNSMSVDGSGAVNSQTISSLPLQMAASVSQRSSSMASSAQGSGGRMLSSPTCSHTARASASEGHASPNAHSDIANSFSDLLSENSSKGSSHQPLQTKRSKQYPDDFVPEIIRIYAQEFPVELSPNVLLKVMRGIYSSTRTSLINVDIELSWCMILKGILPRILLFSYIASMARGKVIDAELMTQLPPKFDEICYEYAVKDIPLATASPSLWSALSLHMIGRYEFQSSRYELMLQHYEMAADIMTKTTFHGYAFPWIDVPDHLKRTFEYDYY